MYKYLFLALLFIVGVMTYFKNVKEVQQKRAEEAAKKAAEAARTASITEIRKTKNRIAVGTCFWIPGSDLEYYKVTSFDADNSYYRYKLCHKFKSCLSEEGQEDLNAFEKKYQVEKELPCPL